MSSRKLPASESAEAAVVGAVLLRPEVLAGLELEPRHFFDPRHKAIFAAMRSLAASGADIDSVTLEEQLRRDGKLEAVGLDTASAAAISVPTAEHVAHYAAIVRDRWAARELVLRCAEISARAYSGEHTADELLSHAQEQLSELDQLPTNEDASMYSAIREEVNRLREIVERRKTGEKVRTGIPTGLAGLDALITALPFATPIVIGGRPSEGKSTIALHIADMASYSGFGVHILSWEDRRPGWAQRQLARWSGVETQRLRDAQVDDHDIIRLTGAVDRIGRRPWEVEHCHGMGVDQAIRRVRARRVRNKTRVVIGDYLQLAPPPPGWERRKTHEIIGENTRRLCNELAYRDGDCLLLLSQLNRDADDGVPSMKMLKASGAIEEHAKLIILLDRPRDSQGRVESDRDDAMVARVVKNHQGAKGLVEVQWWKSHSKLQ